MNIVSVIEDTIKNHPLIEFDNRPSSTPEYWGLCPCGFSTKHYRTRKAVDTAFQNHVAEEINEELESVGLLKPNRPSTASFRLAPAVAPAYA